MKIENTTIEQPVKQLNLGFLGLGWIGRSRMQRLLQNPAVKCEAIVEPDPKNAEEALASTKGKLFHAAEELFSDPILDGIVIATPSAMHADQSIAALREGKAVFCQKPLGRNAREVEQVLLMAQKNNKNLAVDLSYRYTKAFEAVYNLVKSGEIGEIYAVDLVFHNAYGPDKEWFYDMEKSGGGCVLDLGIHILDLALWTLDYPKIAEIHSHLFKNGKKLLPQENSVEDFATVTALTGNNISLNLGCSWNVSVGREAVIEAKFYGTKGGAAFKNVNGSFYDFVAERYNGTQTETLFSEQDDWSGRAGEVWAENVLNGKGFDGQSAAELLELSKIIDRIYGRS